MSPKLFLFPPVLDWNSNQALALQVHRGLELLFPLLPHQPMVFETNKIFCLFSLRKVTDGDRNVGLPVKPFFP
ncbi:hypothetical protein XENTR_v10002869 [Xenopus tropicalis]|nr:hypothetical protein XENTR_v10002869 [Xenopus tropicalis]